jgi:hypothetical protein
MSRSSTVAAVAGGLVIAMLGAVGALSPTASDTAAWLLGGVLAGALLAVATAGLRAATRDVPLARPALAVAVAGLVLFALAHGYAIVDPAAGPLLFAVFTIVAALGLIVAGIRIARAWRGPARFLPLLCGAWPLLVPALAPLGDGPLFAAILVWGLCWIALGAVLWVPADERSPAHG